MARILVVLAVLVFAFGFRRAFSIRPRRATPNTILVLWAVLLILGFVVIARVALYR